MDGISEDMLGDLSGYPNLKKDAKHLREELQVWRTDQFDNWSRNIISMIDDPSAKLRLIYFIHNISYLILCYYFIDYFTLVEFFSIVQRPSSGVSY